MKRRAEKRKGLGALQDAVRGRNGVWRGIRISWTGANDMVSEGHWIWEANQFIHGMKVCTLNL